MINRNKSKIGALFAIMILAIYLFIVLHRSWALIFVPQIEAKIFGMALMFFPVLGLWVAYREILFGYKIGKMSRDLEKFGELPRDDFARSPSGKIIRESAAEAFSFYSNKTLENSTDWRGWFQLSCIYDVLGERKKARTNMRRAIKFYEKI